jgi:putative sugar O-methyltransferase
VNFTTGKKYIDRIQNLGFDINDVISKGIQNDLIGNPRTYHYGSAWKISPTTLRYLSVACELQVKFGDLSGLKVVEIGAGYGGQMAVLTRFFELGSYEIYDLPEAQSLISKYLDEIDVALKPRMLNINAIEDSGADLIISNYAYSELPAKVQKEYLSKVLSRCPRGFMIMNSGLTNSTGRSDGKLQIGEIRAKLSRLEVEKEIPLTSEDNYLLTWR